MAFLDRFAAVLGGVTAWQQIYPEKPLEISHFCSWIFPLQRSQGPQGGDRAPTPQVEIFTVYVDAIYHPLLDYENSFADE